MNKTIIEETIAYLKKNYPQPEDIEFYICEGCDCIEASDGTIAFGVYVPSESIIYLATDIPEPELSLIETTAHEYKHFMQHCNNEPFDEEEAEKFAYQILAELRGDV